MDLGKNLTLSSNTHTKQINEAFDTLTFNDTDKQIIEVFAEDRTISISQKILLFSSSFLRSLVSNLPDTQSPAFIIPEASAENIEYIEDILASGEVNFKDKTEDDLTKLVCDAKTLGIDLSSLKFIGDKTPENVKVQKKKPRKPRSTPNKQDLMIDTFLLKSISNLLNQCTVCLKQFSNQTKLLLCYCDHFYQELHEKFASQVQDLSCHLCNKKFFKKKTLLMHIGNVHRMINVILKEKGITQIAKENDQLDSEIIVEEQGVIYKTEEIVEVPVEFSPKIISAISLTEEDMFGAGNIALSGINENQGNVCEVCNDNFANTDSLWIHHCENHFLKDLQINMNKSAKSKKGQCNICDLKLESKKELAVHKGTVHRKLNELLMIKGYMPLDAYGVATNDENVLFHEETEHLIKDSDIIYPCQICGVSLKHLYSLWRHICSTHYMKKLKSDYGNLVRDGLQCDICGVKADDQENVMKHIGIFHFKLNDILANQGRERLEIPSYIKCII